MELLKQKLHINGFPLVTVRPKFRKDMTREESKSESWRGYVISHNYNGLDICFLIMPISYKSNVPRNICADRVNFHYE